MAAEFFTEVEGPVPFAGASTDDLAFKVYDPDRMVLGKRMEEHLRIAVCYWHSFNWPGSDVFGAGTFDRPWLQATGDPMDAAQQKMDAAFEFFSKLGTPFFCFHDVDIAPEGATFAESASNLDVMVDYAEKKMAETGVQPAVGNGQPVLPPPLRRRGGDQPGPGRVRLRRRPGEARPRGDPPAGWRQLRVVGRPGGLRDAAQHRPRARGRSAGTVPDDGRRAQAQDRIRGNPADRAQAGRADQAPVRLRLPVGPRLSGALRPGRRVPGQHRRQPRHPGRAQLPP